MTWERSAFDRPAACLTAALSLTCVPLAAETAPAAPSAAAPPPVVSPGPEPMASRVSAVVVFPSTRR